ncbi:MAG: LPS assembly protein LptD [Candidatus Omnitrophica bacterium]|nr:LPS assembly protein LptD [Candidatus Omnitrophota bacterium]
MVKLKSGQPIIVDGDKVEFFERENKIVAEGNVSIEYGEVTLKCDSIEVNTKTQKAACRGNVRIEHSAGVLTGDYIVYDLLNKRGEILEGEVKAFPWFGQAEETARVGDNEYLLKKGSVSTCDLDSPHYRIEAKEIRVFPDDKVIAKNAVVYIGKVPVMWFPYYYHPIINTRAKVQFIPGRSSDWGYFLLSAWRFYLKGNTRVDALLDYRTKKGFAEGANLYYFMNDLGLSGLGEGIFRAYFVQQNERGTYDPTPFRNDDEGAEPELRKRFQWMHRIDFDPQTVGMIEFNKLSDEYVIKDYYYDEYEENNWVPQNYASITTAQPNFMLNLELKKRFNDFYTVVQKLPEARIDIPQQRFWSTPIFYQSSTRATVFEKKYEFNSQPAETVERFDTFQQFSYAAKLGFLNLVPYGTFRETVYSKDKSEKNVIARTTIGGGIDAFSSFHRTFDVNSDWGGMDINGLRHIIVPKVRYFHTRQPNVDKDDLFQMDDLDEIEKENGVALSLENKLQTKRYYGGCLKQVDLARLIISTTYDFRMKKREFKFEKESGFSDVTFDMELRPYNWFYIDGKLDIVPSNAAIKTGSLEFVLEPGKDFRLNFGYRYEKKIVDSQNELTFDLTYRLNPKWRFGWYERFDLKRREIEEQQFSVTRDLHCWEVEVAYDISGSNFLKDDYTLWIAFKIKAFPDLQLGLSRNFTRRPAGATRR